MGILQEMQQKPHWGNVTDYPRVQWATLLREDITYANKIVSAFSSARSTDNSAIEVVPLQSGQELPTDTTLCGLIEDHRYEGSATYIEKQTEETGAPENTEYFEEVARALTDSRFYTGPSAQIEVRGVIPGRWRLYERRQVLAVPELNRNGKPTGQFIGRISDEALNGLPRGADLAGRAGNIILPRTVRVGHAFKPEKGPWRASHQRTIVAGWYYRLVSEQD